MKYFLILLFIAIIACGGYGFYLKSDLNEAADKFIGFGVLGLFFVWMPLFIVYRYRGKDLKKYMINDDTFKKIKEEADTFIDKK